ncbi:hypothetical protein NVS55_22430 [Myxococcus stipitatus]|uniref:hypothetical protein n=1 Tax=Myxococcus stipitatus TaxID=83455 RepID=UPI00314558DE
MFRRTLPVLPMMLSLSLTACGDELDPERVPPQSVWVTSRVGTHSELRTVSYDLLPGGYLSFVREGRPSLGACATYAPHGRLGVDGDSTACMVLDLDSAVLGTGPKKFKVAGQSSYTVEGFSTAFTPGAGHSPEIKAAYASISCEAWDPADAVQDVSGRVVLEENSDTRLSGYVVATSIGKTVGCAFGDKTEVNIRFDITR